MHPIIEYYRLSMSGILLSNWNFGILLICQIGILRDERYITFIHVMEYRNTVDLSVSNITYKYRFAFKICPRETCEKLVYKHPETIYYVNN